MTNQEPPENNEPTEGTDAPGADAPPPPPAPPTTPDTGAPAPDAEPAEPTLPVTGTPPPGTPPPPGAPQKPATPPGPGIQLPGSTPPPPGAPGAQPGPGAPPAPGAPPGPGSVPAPPPGAPQMGPGGFSTAGAPAKKNNGMAIASLVLGILFCVPFGGILAIIFGFIARKQIKNSEGRQTGSGMATAGIVLGVLGIIASASLGILAASGAFEEDVPSRSDFVQTVSDEIEADPSFGPGTYPEEVQPDVRQVLENYSGCIYDQLEDEPKYLNEVYDDPTSESQVVNGVSQDDIDAIDEAINSQCVPDLQQGLQDIGGGG